MSHLGNVVHLQLKARILDELLEASCAVHGWQGGMGERRGGGGMTHSARGAAAPCVKQRKREMGRNAWRRKTRQ